MKGLAGVFDMGAYHEASAGLDLAVMEKDSGMVVAALENMFGRVDEIESWRRSSLYEHMTFREVGEKFWEQLKQKVIEEFGDQEKYDFLNGDDRWRKLAGKP